MVAGAIVLLAGCVAYQANRTDVAQRVGSMLSENEYARALDTIALVKPSHPDYKRLTGWRGTIEKNARAWETEIVNDVEQMMNAGQWFNAEQQLEEGMRKLPDSAAFDQAHDRFLSRRGEHLRGVNHELMLARGRGLPAEIAALEKLALVSPRDQLLAAEVERRRTMLSDAQQHLVNCARDALAAGQTERAAECLQVAQSIGRSAEIDRLLAATQRTNTVKKKQVQAVKQKRTERDQARRVEELRVGYNRSMQNGDLNAAREQLNELIKLQPSPALRKDSVRLDQRIKRRVDRSLQDGRTLYTQGDFKGARAIWVTALRLDPANQELKDNIARAERVLKKIEKLSSDQQTE